MTRTPTRRLRRIVATVAATAAAALALVACTPAQPSETPTTQAPSSEVSIPSTAVGERMQWMLGLLNQEADLTEADLDGAFDASFTAVVSLAEVVDLLNKQIRPAQPIVVTAYQGSETQAVADAAGSVGEPFAIHLSLTADGLIDGFALTPVTTPDPAHSLEDVQQRLEQLGVPVQYSVTRTAPDGTSDVLLEHGADQAAPMASMFKLYVLLAVHDAVQAGELNWSDELIVTDATRSLPSGELQNEANGTKVSLRDAALAMISISDNTATDMLIDAVGRDRVEAAVVSAGHHDPALLTPFLTTRELFMLGFGVDQSVRDEWAAASVSERRTLLAEITIDLDAITPADFAVDPFWQKGLDWFATPADIAAAHTTLAALSDPEVAAALMANPGVQVDATAWPEVAYKGGSSVGVLTGSWHAVAPDGTTLTIVVMASSSDAEAVAAAQLEIFSLMADVFRLAVE